MLARALLGAAKKVIEFVGSTAGALGTSDASVDVPLPSGTPLAKGDVVVVCWGFTNPTDLTLSIGTTGYTKVCDLFAVDTRSTNMAVAYKVMGDTPDTTVSLSTSSAVGYPLLYAIHAWRGVNAATPLDVAATTATGSNFGRPDCPAITPVTAGAVVLACGLAGDGGTTTAVFTAPTGMGNLSTFTAVGTIAGADVGIASAVWAGGAYDPAAFGGGSNSTSDSWCAATLALRPA